jgi:hypothetical protein
LEVAMSIIYKALKAKQRYASTVPHRSWEQQVSRRISDHTVTASPRPNGRGFAGQPAYKRESFAGRGNNRLPRAPQHEETAKILLLACCYQDVMEAIKGARLPGGPLYSIFEVL